MKKILLILTIIIILITSTNISAEYEEEIVQNDEVLLSEQKDNIEYEKNVIHNDEILEIDQDNNTDITILDESELDYEYIDDFDGTHINNNEESIDSIDERPSALPVILSVEIFSDDYIQSFGQKVTLYSIVTSKNCTEILYQWQINRGNGWEDIGGANEECYSFIFNEDDLDYYWRLLVIAC